MIVRTEYRGPEDEVEEVSQQGGGVSEAEAGGGLPANHHPPHQLCLRPPLLSPQWWSNILSMGRLDLS